MKPIMVIAMLLASLCGFGQERVVVVSNEKYNILDVDIENPVRALIEKIPAKNVVLTAKDAEIRKSAAGSFTIAPLKPGIIKVNACKVVKGDTIVMGSWEFRAKLMEVNGLVCGKRGGPIKKSVLIAQGGVIAYIGDCSDLGGGVKEYTLIVMRDGNVIGTSRNLGPRFSEESKELVNRLQANDKLLVVNLTTLIPSYSIKQASPMEFVIEE